MSLAEASARVTGRLKLEGKETLRLLVVSDIHAYSDLKEHEREPSYVHMNAVDEPRDPLTSLATYLAKNRITADAVICCGDMGDKARPAATRFVWGHLQALANTVTAPLILPTTGNHDVDSRGGYTEFDAKGVLQSLRPPFPLPEEELNDRYWSRHYVLLEWGRQMRCVLLNSAAYHGVQFSNDTPEYEQGRISKWTLQGLRDDLERSDQGSGPPPVNILVVHHHPHRHGDMDRDDSVMLLGGDLLKLLGSENHGRWLVVHGHKHHPRLANAAGGGSAPIVFSAGSLGAILHKDIHGSARNQCHLLEVRLNTRALAGRFQSWEWSVGEADGWRPARSGSGLPARGGFGEQRAYEHLADEVENLLRDGTIRRWNDLCGQIPALEHTLPVDILQVCKELKRRGVSVSPDGEEPEYFQRGTP